MGGWRMESGFGLLYQRGVKNGLAANSNGLWFTHTDWSSPTELQDFYIPKVPNTRLGQWK